MKTSELTGAALDWAVAKCEGLTLYEDAMLSGLLKRGWWVSGMSIDPNTWHPLAMFNPSTDWAQGGPIIEREMREFGFDLWSGVHVPDGQFAATYCRGAPDSYVYGPTPLIAAMRCYVASKLGEDVSIPEELT